MNEMVQPLRLTSLAHGGGCGCKIAPAVLSEILQCMPTRLIPPELLGGTDNNEDAAVYKLNDSQAIVATRMLQPGFEWRVLRTLQLLQFNTPLLLDDESQLQAALSSVEDLNLDLVMAALDSPEVQKAYRADWNAARDPGGGAVMRPRACRAAPAAHAPAPGWRPAAR